MSHFRLLFDHFLSLQLSFPLVLFIEIIPFGRRIRSTIEFGWLFRLHCMRSSLVTYFASEIYSIYVRCRLFIQTLMLTVDLITNHEIIQQLTTRWPIVALLIASALIVFAIAEICKYEELK